MGMPPSSQQQQQPQATVSIQHQNSMTTNTPVHVSSGAQVQVVAEFFHSPFSTGQYKAA